MNHVWESGLGHSNAINEVVKDVIISFPLVRLSAIRYVLPD